MGPIGPIGRISPLVPEDRGEGRNTVAGCCARRGATVLVPSNLRLPFWRRVMRIPVVRGVMDRRILVNYRVDPQVLAAALPPPFRPKLVHGVGMVGICLIRLKDIRPAF